MVEIQPEAQSAQQQQRQQSEGENNKKHQAQVKGLFQSTSLDVWQLYKQSIRAIEVSYLRGKEQAFDEVMKYLVAQGTNSDFRYIPIKEFISYIESRYQAHREECEARNQALPQQQNTSSQSSQSNNSSNRGAQRQQHQNSGSGNFHLERATKEVQASLDNLASQARTIAEEEGLLTQVQSRLSKLSFDIFKVKGTKKRRHPDSQLGVGSFHSSAQIGVDRQTQMLRGTDLNRINQNYNNNNRSSLGNTSLMAANDIGPSLSIGQSAKHFRQAIPNQAILNESVSFQSSSQITGGGARPQFANSSHRSAANFNQTNFNHNNRTINQDNRQNQLGSSQLQQSAQQHLNNSQIRNNQQSNQATRNMAQQPNRAKIDFSAYTTHGNQSKQ